MKKYQIALIAVFFALLLLPMAAFTREENIASKIDNRMLANNPFGPNAVIDSETGLSGAVERYVSDRIGYRTEMIRLYTQLSDKLFGVMVHPSYTYGRNGHVFLPDPGDGPELSDLKRTFADMVIRIQHYCDQRGVPFLFAFDPIKNAVYRDELPVGMNFNNDWKEEFFALLDQGGVNYVDTTDTLIQKRQDGQVVFNRKFNAGHWNNCGAFFGVNHMLAALEGDFPALTPNRMEDFFIWTRLDATLPASEFPIHEFETIYEYRCRVDDLTNTLAGEVKLDPQYTYFRYTVNPDQLEKGAPRTLVLQGSYMNGMGYKFLDTRLGEYIAVHNYQNITDFDYYFNLFQPECVIFEVGEYVFTERYFSTQRMAAAQLNPVLDTFAALPEEEGLLETGQVQLREGEALTTLTVTGLPADTRYAYAIIGDTVYDLHRGEEGCTLTLRNGTFDGLTVVTVDDAQQVRRVFRTE